jgi:hypothetical protein
MPIERSVFLEVLKDSYSAYYNVSEAEAPSLPLSFRADYHNRDERYLLTKSIKYWGNEKNEFAYVFSASAPDADLIARCIDYAWNDAMPRVKPHKEHQCTNVKVVFVADTLDEAAVKVLQKDNRTKNYKFGLHGYSNLLAGAVDLQQQKTYTNKAGYELASYFRKLFAAREKKPEANGHKLSIFHKE